MERDNGQYERIQQTPSVSHLPKAREVVERRYVFYIVAWQCLDAGRQRQALL